MAAFSASENLFEQSTYDMNDYMSDAFPHDPFLSSKDADTSDSHAGAHTSTSPSLTYSESLQPSMSSISHNSCSTTSTASSAIGSPFIDLHQDNEPPFEEWSKDNLWDLGLEPSIMQRDDAYFPGQHADEYDSEMPSIQPGLVSNYPYYHPNQSSFDPHPSGYGAYPPAHFQTTTPAAKSKSNDTSSAPSRTASRSDKSRRPSVGSTGTGSAYSKGSPVASPGFEDDDADRGRCSYPGCGRIFKDLRAHKLTHLSERPEKCPIEKCQYHIKGFARKYDQTRHTLTHYKGTMVCGFCPGSGSAIEKSFNRADVFKRHLTSVHGVEQTPSNSRRKGPASSKKSISAEENQEGKCSTCGTVFGSAQEFYNHLDDCVMKVLEKPEISETVNEKHLTAVSNDHAVKATLERHNLPTEVEDEIPQAPEDEDDVMEEDDDNTLETKTNSVSKRASKSGRGMTRSKGGVPSMSKGRRKRKDYPHSWGCGKEQMKMKKRVLCVFDGPRRLYKDEMMMDNDFEVRVDYGEGKYVTDLDVATIERARALHSATEEEKGQAHLLPKEEVTKLML